MEFHLIVLAKNANEVAAVFQPFLSRLQLKFSRFESKKQIY
jgi:hypothetical protein